VAEVAEVRTMSAGPLNPVLRHIRRVAHAGLGGETDDAGLLERFLSQHDEAAFEILLKRHGPMVLGVCRRLLRDPHAADDAFQAVFLVLLRKARTLRKRELLANWLYGVAYRTALRARRVGARLHAREKAMSEIPAADSDDASIWRDLRPVLDDELHRLPDKYRRPVVLCYLEGKTFTEAARDLGWPAGTVSGRLARARKILQSRLTRRGITLSGAALGVVLMEKALTAAVPVPLFDQTIKAATLLAAGSAGAVGGFALPVSALAEGVMQTIYLTKMKLVVTTVLALGILAAGAGVITLQRLDARQPAVRLARKTEPLERNQVDEKPKLLADEVAQLNQRAEDGRIADMPADQLKSLLDAIPNGSKVGALLKDQLEAAQTETTARWKEFCAGRGTLDICMAASQRLLQAERELSRKRADQVAAFQAHWQRMKDIEAINKARYEASRIPIQDYAQSRFNRIQAEIWVERAKAGLPPRPES
jgi:RNA polymerase sigma factor (sigma-70 family)